jgi:putative PIN family toxin of toxin-antitoxin system
VRIVCDTNVVLSALLNPYGPPARILALVVNRDVRLILDNRILFEYREVLTRSRFRLNHAAVVQVLDFLEATAERVIAVPAAVTSPDPDDLPFLEAAVAGGADALVTGNRRHFPQRACGGIPVMSPSEFLAHWHQRRVNER